MKYKRIYEADEVVIDINEETQQLRISEFYDNHFQDEHFISLEELLEYLREKSVD